jgi:hypothetical protein
MSLGVSGVSTGVPPVPAISPVPWISLVPGTSAVYVVSSLPGISHPSYAFA